MVAAAAVEARCTVCEACGGDGHALRAFVGGKYVEGSSSHFFTAARTWQGCDLCERPACRTCGGFGRVGFSD